MKTNKNARAFDPFVELPAPELSAALELAAQALALADKNKHSVSLLYGAHNALTGQKINPESCPSCLKQRVAWLRKFCKDNKEKLNALIDGWIAEQIAEPPPAPKTEATEEKPAGRVLNLVTEGEPDVKVMFDETGKNKQGESTGVVSASTGKTLKPGKYAVDTGETLVVQPGGKATLKPFEDLT